MAFVSYLSVLRNVYPEQFNPPTSQRVFTSPYIRMHRFAIQSLIGNSGRTCECSADVVKSTNRGINARKQWRTLNKNYLQQVTKKIEKYILLNLTTWRCFSVHFTSKLPQEKYISCKTPTYQACDLPAWEFPFPLSEMSMQMRLITWLNLTSIANSKWQRRSWRGLRKESHSPRFRAI